MKPGVRALGVAESFRRDREHSTLGGAVVRASRVTDGFSLATATVGGTDATDAVVDCYRRLDREDVQYVLVAGIALSWYNVVDLHAVHDATERPVLSVSFEAGDSLAEPLREQFDGDSLRERLATYRAQPSRRVVEVDHGRAFVRAVGVGDDEAERVVRAFTPEGGRPEPLRVARLFARAVERARGLER